MRRAFIWSGCLLALISVTIAATHWIDASKAVAQLPAPRRSAAAQSHKTLPQFDISYMLEQSMKDGSYVSDFFDESQGFAAVFGLAIFPMSGPGGAADAQPCGSEHARCAYYPEFFLPFVVSEHPSNQLRVAASGLSTSLLVTSTTHEYWDRASCKIYTEVPDKPQPEFLKQEYTACPGIGIIDIKIWTQSSGHPNPLPMHFILTSSKGLLASGQVLPTGE